MRRSAWADATVFLAVTALLLHLPLPAAGGTALSPRGHIEAWFPDTDILLNVAFATIDSKNLATGRSFSWTFDEPGGFAYHCHPHPWMRALVVVTPDPGTQPTVHRVAIVEGLPDAPSEWGFLPQNITIRQGDTVVWTNQGSMAHSVTGNMGPATDLASADAFVEQQRKAERAIFVVGTLGGLLAGIVVSLFLVQWMRRTGRV